MAQLFANFEVNRVPRWPMLSRLLMASVVAHGLLMVTVAYVPSVRGLFGAATSLSGFEFVSEDYDRSLVGQRATIINVASDGKLYYPADYFGVVTPYADPLNDPALIAQAQPTPPPPMPVYKPRRAPATPRVVSAAPTPSPEASPSPEVAQATPSPSPLTPEEKKRAEDAEFDRIARENNIRRPAQINTRPFEDIAQKGKDLIDKGSLDLKSSVVDVSVAAERNEDGTLKNDTVKIDGTAGNAAMSELATEFVNAVSQSRVLSALEGTGEVRMGVKLDDQKVSVRIASVMASDERASQMANGYGLMLLAARIKKEGTVEGELWKNVQVRTEGNQLVMIFEMPREAAAKMIADKLAKKAAAAAQPPSKG